MPSVRIAARRPRARAQVVACISKGVSETMHLLETDEGQHDKLTDVTVRLVLYEQASPSPLPRAVRGTWGYSASKSRLKQSHQCCPGNVGEDAPLRRGP